MKSLRQRSATAAAFAKEWRGRGYEKGEAQKFWLSLLRDVCGEEHPERLINFEVPVRTASGHTGFIDAYIPSTRTLIEMKGRSVDLLREARQSDGRLLTAYQQAERYRTGLRWSEQPRWIVTCNFRRFLVYDMERPEDEPESIALADLGREFYRLDFLTDTAAGRRAKEERVSVMAGRLVGELYDGLRACYLNPDDDASLRALNVLCVRLVFCLYAEDSGVFPEKDQFFHYLHPYSADDTRDALLRLFRCLDTPEESRDPYSPAALLAFPYVGGGLFTEEAEVPRFTPELREALLWQASLGFDWSGISPTVFGAVFESTLNPATRRAGGMHYTSVQNIHRLIDPLFLDSLTKELDTILADTNARRRRISLAAYQERLASLTFLDPACGSGNFLTETYLSLRRLENRAIEAIYGGERLMAGMHNPVRVSISQFHGLEVNDFAVSVSRVALWIAEAQSLMETERVVQREMAFLPLPAYEGVREANALRQPWQDIVEPERLSYIIGNPPFVGARLKTQAQAADMEAVFGKEWTGLGNLDYVCAWYKLAADLMTLCAERGNTDTRAAFVSTNSVSQGEQVALLWEPLCAGRGVRINFARRTFRWDSEAFSKAHVHVVVIGFSLSETKPCLLWPSPAAGGAKDGETDSTPAPVPHINGYLLPAPDVFVQPRKTPLCPVPTIGIGNKPIDGGAYLFTAEERDSFTAREPAAAPLFRPWYGAEELIKQKPRYCLWLGDCTPAELRRMPACLERVERVRALRLASKSAGTRKLADRPTRFHVENMPATESVAIPRVSSEKRAYIPMGLLPPTSLGSDSMHIIPGATAYHFGVLESRTHMAWTRAVCGRLEMRYRYSKDVVYNNFPWPAAPSEADTKRVEQTAEGILAARALYPDSSLADLYDERAMPAELRRAHEANDRAVASLYGLPPDLTEEETVARLFALYQKLARRSDKSAKRASKTAPAKRKAKKND